MLYWIALHPMEGDDTAIEQLPALGFESRAVDVEQTRERVALYAVKLLGRLVGAIRAARCVARSTFTSELGRFRS